MFHQIRFSGGRETVESNFQYQILYFVDTFSIDPTPRHFLQVLDVLSEPKRGEHLAPLVERICRKALNPFGSQQRTSRIQPSSAEGLRLWVL